MCFRLSDLLISQAGEREGLGGIELISPIDFAKRAFSMLSTRSAGLIRCCRERVPPAGDEYGWQQARKAEKLTSDPCR